MTTGWTASCVASSGLPIRPPTSRFCLVGGAEHMDSAGPDANLRARPTRETRFAGLADGLRYAPLQVERQRGRLWGEDDDGVTALLIYVARRLALALVTCAAISVL